MTLTTARRIIGSLSFPSKMPGTSYGLPATACIAGSRLAKIPGTPCSLCYALKDHYTWTNSVKAQQRRLAAITDPRWVDAMVRVLLYTHAKPFLKVDLGLSPQKRPRAFEANGGKRWRMNPTGFHRWHDSGDLQSIEHLAAICAVVRRTPRIRHWLPTQELRMVNSFIAQGGVIPENLVIRVSSAFLNDTKLRAWPQTSAVYSVRRLPDEAHVCPAPKQEHRCGDCRACWSHTVAHVAYELH